MNRSDLLDFFKNLSKENTERIIEVSIKRVQEYRAKQKRNEPLTYVEEMFLKYMGDSVDYHLSLSKLEKEVDDIEKEIDNIGATINKEDDQPKINNKTIISLDCPHCSMFGCYEVEKNIDSILKCRTCEEKFRIRGNKF